MRRMSRLLGVRSGLATKPGPAPPAFREYCQSQRHAKPEKKNGCSLPSVTASHVSNNWLRRRQRRADHQPHVDSGGDLTIPHNRLQIIHNAVEVLACLRVSCIDHLNGKLRTVENRLPLSADTWERHFKTLPNPAPIECSGRGRNSSFGRATIEFAFDRGRKIDDTLRVRANWVSRNLRWREEYQVRLSPVNASRFRENCDHRERHKKPNQQNTPRTIVPHQTFQQIKTSLLSLTMHARSRRGPPILQFESKSLPLSRNVIMTSVCALTAVGRSES
jgi:hypothetical protein